MATSGRTRGIPVGLGVLSMAVALGQRPAELIADTKVSLYLDPVRFLGQVASAWSPTTDLGHVWAGQYGGYLFPMGPFFATGSALGIPMWLVHRLWLGVLLAVAAWGVVRLLDALWDGPRGVAHLAAGALFVVNPYVTVYANRTSVVLLAYAALPWLMLLVHRGLRQPRGWWFPAAFALVLTSTGGGVNVAVTAWILLGPLLLCLYERGWGGVGKGALGPWLLRLAVCNAVASAWWLVPIVVHAGYGLNFLPFTEQPGTIWSTTSISESLRLMGFWTSYVGVGFGPRWQPFAGHGGVLLFDRAVVVAELVVPALALAGFWWTRRWRYGPFFLALTVLGLMVMAAGWPGGAPLRQGLTFVYYHVQALQFLRTTYKAGPLVALGVACLGGVALAGATQLLRGGVGRWRAAGEGRRGRLSARAPLVALLTVLTGTVLLAAWPLVSGRAVEKQLRFAVPAPWYALADDLDHRSDNTRALLEPGQLFAFSSWGGTIDNVLPSLTRHPVATRYIVPFSDLRAANLQWSVEDLIAQERVLPGQLPPLLDLMGVGDLVFAADEDRGHGGNPSPLEARRALGPLPPPARSYGPMFSLGPGAGRLGKPVRVPELQRFSVPTGGLVRLLPRGPMTVIDGSAEGLADLAGFGQLDPARPIVYAADLSPGALRTAAAEGATVVVSDSNRRQAFVASRVRGNRGPPLTASQTVSADGTMLDPFPARGSDAQTVAVLRGASDVSAPASPQVTQYPERRPFAALDGDPSTAWLADQSLEPERRHLDITFTAPRDVPYLDILPYSDSRATVLALSVNGRRFAVHEGWNRLTVRMRHVASVQLLIAGLRRPLLGSAGGGGLREVRIPGLHVSELLRPPVLAERDLAGRELPATGLDYLLDRRTADVPRRVGRWAGELQRRRPRDARHSETQLVRIIGPPAARGWRVAAWTSVEPSAPDDLIDRLAGVRGTGTARSSSRYQNLPGFRASGAFAGANGPGWIGQWLPGHAVWLEWRTPRPTTVAHLRLVPGREIVRRPILVRLEAGAARSGSLTVAPDGTVRLPRPLRGRTFRLKILAARFPVGTPARVRQRAAVGIGQVVGAGLTLRVPRRGPLAARCGSAAIVLGSHRVALRAGGDVAALDAGQPLFAAACGPPVALAAGTEIVRGLHGPLVVDHLWLHSRAPRAIAAGRPHEPAGSVLSAGRLGDGERTGVRLSVRAPAWLVLGESYDRGWRATCDGRELGAPTPLQGFANAWRVDPGCRAVSFSFGPNRALLVGYLLSGLGCLVLLGLLLVSRRAALAAGGRVLGPLPDAPAPRALSPHRAVAAGLLVGGAISFLFALRAGAVAAPVVALLLWRGVGVRALIAGAGILLAVGVPVAYLLSRWDDRGGFNGFYAADHIAGHWLAVAAVCLLVLALIRTLNTARDRHGSPAVGPPGEGA
ncbi:MAG TPA: alpha-(1-_3)-arabinofuranosyltransferase family protein [Solirubrobacteraceae bacterium]|jgi:hypothetical protein|nr:alpha-(1->3)-arabinofuranosyltransferase family protein [Solirubrobacteraceae bacterium]